MVTTRTYMTGYNGTVRTESSLLTWSVWQGFDPEFRDRLKQLMDYMIDNGHKTGVGGGIRSTSGQLGLFYERHHQVAAGQPHCCTYGGRYYQLNAGQAHAAPPGRSYHEAVPPYPTCFAADMVGDVKWMDTVEQKFGLVDFGNINGESWHLQPAELPHARVNLKPGMLPLKHFGAGAPLPPPVPKPPTPYIIVPLPTLRLVDVKPYMSGKEVATLQQIMKHFGWYAGTVDGWFGPVTAWAVSEMQKAINKAGYKPALVVDGVYGPATAAGYRWFAQGVAPFAIS